METWTTQIAADHGFQDVQHNLEIFGSCSDCADAEARQATEHGAK
jgi:Fur family ferric uptake transcriptional regulator